MLATINHIAQIVPIFSWVSLFFPHRLAHCHLDARQLLMQDNFEGLFRQAEYISFYLP